jgi:hypothetical protein
MELESLIELLELSEELTLESEESENPLATELRMSESQENIVKSFCLKSANHNTGNHSYLCKHRLKTYACISLFLVDIMQASWFLLGACMGNDNHDEVTGRARGGMARAKALSPDARRDIARKAAAARWGDKQPQATHKGSFKADFGIDVECYVLNDDAKTAVISQRGMGAAIGLGVGGSRLPSFVKGKTISQYVGHELSQKLENPLIFQGPSAGGTLPPVSKIHGYDVTILIDVCKAIVSAESDGKLLKSQANIAKQAHVILNASAKAGIKGLVYALSGYDATREEVITAFKLYVRDEAREYEKEFPDQLYEQWYRLYKLPKPQRNKPWKFKHLTVSQVYTPLARSNGKILQLTQAQKANSKEKWKKLHQFLADVGVKALRQHLGQLLGIAQISDDQAQYEKHVQKVFGGQQSLDL